MNVRFTAWFSERERNAIADRARIGRSSSNLIVREAVREYLGLDDSPEQLLHVTSDTPTVKDPAI